MFILVTMATKKSIKKGQISKLDLLANLICYKKIIIIYHNMKNRFDIIILRYHN